MCVSVSEYITYNRKDHCICGAKHVKHCRSSDGRVCAYNAPRGYDSYICRRLGCFYLISTYFGGNLYYGERINERITPRSSILEANSQIRAEALPVFYGTNDFVFERCEPAWVTQWIYKGVQPKHLKYIKSIAWDGPLRVGDESDLLRFEHRLRPEKRDPSDDSDHISATILLMQLGFLGKCKLKFEVEDREQLHAGCLLHQKVMRLVQRKTLTPAHIENENFELDKHEVRGLVYSLVRHFDAWWNTIDKNEIETDDPQGNPTSYCGCSLSHDDWSVPWITKTPLLTADESGQELQDPAVD
jgi:hypothetical protein